MDKKDQANISHKPKIETVNIHGKQYMPVAGRVQLVHEDRPESIVIDTEVLSHNPIVVVKAKVQIKFKDRVIETSGISAANPSKNIEKQSPYEVAETSAVGRALGFAGYGSVESIASADEVIKAVAQENRNDSPSHDSFRHNGNVTEKQIGFIEKLLKQKGHTKNELLLKYDVTAMNQLTSEQASMIIDNLMKLPDKETEPEIDLDEVDKGIQETIK